MGANAIIGLRMETVSFPEKCNCQKDGLNFETFPFELVLYGTAVNIRK